MTGLVKLEIGRGASTEPIGVLFNHLRQRNEAIKEIVPVIYVTIKNVTFFTILVPSGRFLVSVLYVHTVLFCFVFWTGFVHVVLAVLELSLC